MTTDRGLRQLEHRAQLADRQLVAFEQDEHPAAERVAEHGEVVEDCGFHPLIRINCFIAEANCQQLARAV